jgi:hypothetical protein
LQSNNHDTMAGHNDGWGEVLLLSIPAKVEGGDGHDSGSGLSTAVEHHGTTAGLRQEQRQEINRGEKGSLGVLAHQWGGVPVRCNNSELRVTAMLGVGGVHRGR